MRLIFAAALVATAFNANADTWKYVQANVGSNRWAVVGGNAELDLKSGTFAGTATNDAGRPAAQIKGLIKGKKVTATLTTLNSDVPPEPLTGVYGRHLDGETLWESIVLSNEWSMVGFTRTTTTPKR